MLIGAYFVLHGNSPAKPPAGGRTSSAPTAKYQCLGEPWDPVHQRVRAAPGQCLQNPPASQTVLGVTYVTVVPCSTPHNAQAFVQFSATGTGYPGVDALKRQADTGCPRDPAERADLEDQELDDAALPVSAAGVLD